MRFFSGFCCKRNLSYLMHLLSMLALGAVLSGSGAPAQEAPNAAGGGQEPRPAPVVFENRIAAGELAFLKDYAARPAKALLKDKQFRGLMKEAVPRTEYHYGSDMPLFDAIYEVLDGSSEPVSVREGRYAMVSGHGGPYLRGRGFMWFDMQEGVALGGFYFQPTNGEPTPTFTVFSRQLKDEVLSMSELPLAFAEDASRWAAAEGVPAVTPRYFIPDSGRKYVLEHDEDYCDHPENAPAPPQEECMRMNAEAADADVNAAYFMKETHNQANATAWMLGTDQVAWIGVRDRTCGIAGLACRIRVTRQRVRVLTGPRRR